MASSTNAVSPTSDIAKIVKTLTNSIGATFHTRVTYPWQKKISPEKCGFIFDFFFADTANIEGFVKSHYLLVLALTQGFCFSSYNCQIKHMEIGVRIGLFQGLL